MMNPTPSSKARRGKSKRAALPLHPTAKVATTAAIDSNAAPALSAGEALVGPTPMAAGPADGANADAPVVAMTPSNEAIAQVPAPGAPARPGGKLGLLVDRIAAGDGATVDELASATGWQKHTVHGALSRLRTRGFGMRLIRQGERRAYWLDRDAASPNGAERTEG